LLCGIAVSNLFLSHLLTFYTLPMAEMAHFNFSNVIINGSTFNSAHGGLNINNRDPEFGMQDLMSVLKRILIDDPMKDFIP
jgi:hypothetical protein